MPTKKSKLDLPEGMRMRPTREEVFATFPKNGSQAVIDAMWGGLQGGHYIPLNGRLQRLVGDKYKRRPVFSDGRGNGAWEYCCWYCGADGNMINEHMRPVSRRGSDDANNLVAACRSCNTIKRHYTVEEFRALLGERFGIRFVVFAGEIGVATSYRTAFGFVDLIDEEERKAYVDESLSRMNPPPPPSEEDPNET